jgi:hypothetical protein
VATNSAEDWASTSNCWFLGKGLCDGACLRSKGPKPITMLFSNLLFHHIINNPYASLNPGVTKWDFLLGLYILSTSFMTSSSTISVESLVYPHQAAAGKQGVKRNSLIHDYINAGNLHKLVSLQWWGASSRVFFQILYEVQVHGCSSRYCMITHHLAQDFLRRPAHLSWLHVARYAC